MHPYPRKSVDSFKGTSVSSQPERYLSPNVLDKEYQSGTSVISAMASDTSRSPVSEQHNGCSSPTSCTTDMNSVNLSPAEKENEYMTSSSSPEEEKVPSQLATSSAASTLGSYLFMVKLSFECSVNHR